MPDIILGFQGEYKWLSNFWESPIIVTGIHYRNVESAYQAAKSINIADRRTFSNMTGYQAKKAGRTVTLRADWHVAKLEVMELCLRAKFMANKELAMKLVETGSADIVELNTWGDTTWGKIRTKDGTLTGSNYLGKLLMHVRRDLNS